MAGLVLVAQFDRSTAGEKRKKFLFRPGGEQLDPDRQQRGRRRGQIDLLRTHRLPRKRDLRAIDQEPGPQRRRPRQVFGQGLLLTRIQRPIPIAIERLPQRVRRLASPDLVIDEEAQPGGRKPQQLVPRMRDVVRQRRGRKRQP